MVLYFAASETSGIEPEGGQRRERGNASPDRRMWDASEMSKRWNRRPERGVIVAALVALWIAVLALALASQTTELFGVRGGILAWLLFGVAALGFILIGSVGVWLTLSGLDEHNARSRQEGRAGDE